MPAEFSFDASSMDALVGDLRSAASRCDREMAITLGEVGDTVAEAARHVVESEKIRPTIKAHPPMKGYVSVTAGDENVPLAALWDKGNRGRGNSRKKTFSHPVFAQGDRSTWTWVQQVRKPFLAKARALSRPAINELMDATWARILEPLRRGED